jgi:hypothetical protein
MKKTFLFLLVFISITYKITAQNINWGKLSESETMFYTPQIVGQDDQFIYSLSLEKKEPLIEKFDKKTFEKQYSKIVVKPNIEGQESEFERIDLIAGKFVVFSSIYESKSKESKIYATCYDSNTGEKISENTLIFSVPVEKKSRSEFRVFVSKNKKFLLINHIAYLKSQKAYKDLYKLLDQDLNIVVEKEETINKKEIDYRTYNYIVDNEGSFYFAKTYENSDSYIVSYDANKKYEIWQEKIDLSDLKNNAKYSNIVFSINPNNDLIVTGYYTIEGNLLEGCFFMKIENKSKEIVINKVNTFEKSFKEEFLSLKDIKRKKEAKIPDLFNSIQLLHKNDGGIILIGEKYQHLIFQSNYTITHSFLFGDLIVLNISPKGELIWSKRIPKNQARSYNGNFQSMQRIEKKTEFFSYLAGMDKQNIYIYFNENPKNINKQKNAKQKVLSDIEDAVPLKTAMNMENGESNSEIMYDLGQTSVYFKPMDCFQEGQESDIILFAQNKKNYKIGILSFK